MSDPPTTLEYQKQPRAPRWPWVVIGLVAVASCVGYGFYFTGRISYDQLVERGQLIAMGVILVAAIVVGIKYGTQDKDYWA